LLLRKKERGGGKRNNKGEMEGGREKRERESGR
jgi:hypothetical protein